MSNNVNSSSGNNVFLETQDGMMSVLARPSERFVVQAKAGDHYRVLSRSEDQGQLLDDVIALQQGSDLILIYGNGVEIAIEGYFEECVDDACRVILPGDDGIYSLAADAEVEGVDLGNGATMIYAHGNKEVLLALANGGPMASVLTVLDGERITYLAESAVGAESFNLLGVLGSVAGVGLGVAAASSSGSSNNSSSDSGDPTTPPPTDPTNPTVNVRLADSTLTIGETTTVTFTFNEAVSNFTAADITAENGAISGLTTSDNITWTATLTPTVNIEDTTNVVSVGNGYVSASSGATGTSGSSANYTVDTEAPTVKVALSDSALSAGETSTVTFTFSEAVSNFTAADITAENGAISGLTTSDNITWTATFTPTAGITDTSNVISVGTGYTDTAGNTGTSGSSTNYTVDTEAPTVKVTLADSALSAGETTVVTFTFSEAVTGFNGNDVTVANGSIGTPVSSDGGTTWTATLTPTADITDTSNVVSVGTGYTDSADNTGTAGSSANYTVDTEAPTVKVTLADSALSAGETTVVTFTFSEAVTGFDKNDVTVANGSIGTPVSSDGGTTWTATLTPTADITDTSNVVSVGTGYTDSAGNTGTAGSSANYVVNTIPSALTVTHSNGFIGTREINGLVQYEGKNYYYLDWSKSTTGADSADKLNYNWLNSIFNNGSSITGTDESRSFISREGDKIILPNRIELFKLFKSLSSAPSGWGADDLYWTASQDGTGKHTAMSFNGLTINESNSGTNYVVVQVITKAQLQIAALEKIEAYNAGDNASAAAPTVQDYQEAGITGVTAGNLSAVNTQILAAETGGADTVGEVQTLANAGIAAQAQVDALIRIEAYNNGNGNNPSALTIKDYTEAGVTGVSADNLAAVNAQVLQATTGEADSTSEVQALVTAANKALAKIEAYNNGDGISPSALTVQDYKDAGITGVSEFNVALINVSVLAADTGAADTVPEIQALVNTATAVPSSITATVDGDVTKLAGPVSHNGKNYYYWDFDGNGAKNDSDDKWKHDWLDKIFNSNSDTTDADGERTLTTKEGDQLILPSLNELKALFASLGSSPAVWSTDGSYWTSTQIGPGIHYAYSLNGSPSLEADTKANYVVLQVVTKAELDATSKAKAAAPISDEASRAGTADDDITVDASTVSALESDSSVGGKLAAIDGGIGFDTLVMEGAGVVLDFSKIAENRIANIEAIDITGTGDNTLVLSASDVLDITGSGAANTLIVSADAGDTVNAASFVDTNTTKTIDSISYDVYTSGAATLLIDPNATVIL